MADKLLNSIMGFLNEEGMDCTIVDESEDNPFPRLFVYLGTDAKLKERALEITSVEQVLPKNFKDISKLEAESGFYRLQIQTLLPITFEPENAANMASAINFLNGMLELPGFIADEAKAQVFFRNIQLLCGSDCKKALIFGIIGMQRLALDLFTDLLGKIGSGELTYFQLLDEIARYTKV